MDRYRTDALERALVDAGSHLRLCVAYDRNGRGRIVEPYRISTSRRGRRLLHCYQVAGASGSAEPAGWKNLDLATIDRVEPLDVTFVPRGEYAEIARQSQANAEQLRLVD